MVDIDLELPVRFPDYGTLWKFPCGENKAPLQQWGGAQTQTGLTYYDRPSWPLVGVKTGVYNGFDVLDVDPQGIEWLQANAYRIPDTRVHQTRRGGLHLFFQAHEFPPMPNSAGKIAPGVDVRGTGGYVVWWPREGAQVRDPELLAEWPMWLLQLALKSNPLLARSPLEPDVSGWDEALKRYPKTSLRFSANESYARAALISACKLVREAPLGQRENTLNRECFNIGRYAAAGWLWLGYCTHSFVVAMHENRAVDPATGQTFYQEHGRDYVQSKVRRGLLAGLQRPINKVLEDLRSQDPTSLKHRPLTPVAASRLVVQGTTARAQ